MRKDSLKLITNICVFKKLFEISINFLNYQGVFNKPKLNSKHFMNRN